MILRSCLHLAGMALAMIVSTRAPDLVAEARPNMILIVSEDNGPSSVATPTSTGSRPTWSINRCHAGDRKREIQTARRAVVAALLLMHSHFNLPGDRSCKH